MVTASLTFGQSLTVLWSDRDLQVPDSLKGVRHQSVNSNSVGVGLHDVAEFVAHFPERYASKLDDWRRVTDELRRSGRRAVIWGGGSKRRHFLESAEPVGRRRRR